MKNSKIDRSHSDKSNCDHLEAPGAPRVIRFAELAEGAKEIVVEYEDQHYRLRVTKNGKLILNK